MNPLPLIGDASEFARAVHTAAAQLTQVTVARSKDALSLTAEYTEAQESANQLFVRAERCYQDVMFTMRDFPSYQSSLEGPGCLLKTGLDTLARSIEALSCKIDPLEQQSPKGLRRQIQDAVVALHKCAELPQELRSGVACPNAQYLRAKEKLSALLSQTDQPYPEPPSPNTQPLKELIRKSSFSPSEKSDLIVQFDEGLTAIGIQALDELIDASSLSSKDKCALKELVHETLLTDAEQQEWEDQNEIHEDLQEDVPKWQSVIASCDRQHQLSPAIPQKEQPPQSQSTSFDLSALQPLAEDTDPAHWRGGTERLVYCKTGALGEPFETPVVYSIKEVKTLLQKAPLHTSKRLEILQRNLEDLHATFRKTRTLTPEVRAQVEAYQREALQMQSLYEIAEGFNLWVPTQHKVDLASAEPLVRTCEDIIIQCTQLLAQSTS